MTTRYFGQITALFLLCAAAAQINFVPSSGQQLIGVTWLPTGICLGALLMYGLAVWPGVLLGAFVAAISAGLSPVGSLAFAATTLFGTGVAAWGLRHRNFDVALGRVSDASLLFVLGGLGTACMTVMAGAVFGALGPATAIPSAVVRLSADGASVLLVTPAVLCLANLLEKREVWRLREVVTIILLAALNATLALVFFKFIPQSWVTLPLAGLSFPVFLWAAVRCSLTGVAMLGLLTALIVALVSFAGFGPFVQLPTHQGISMFWVFIALAQAAGIVVACAIKTAEQVSDSEARLRELADNSADFIWATDHRGRFTFASRGFEEIWGRTLTELRNRPSLWLDCVHPEDRDAVRAGVKTRAEEQVHSEYRIQRPDGSVRWISGRGSPIFGGNGRVSHFIGVARDITIEKESALALQESQRLLENAQRAGRIGTWISQTYPEGKLHWSNQTCLIFGIDPEAFDGRLETFASRVHPEDLAEISKAASMAIQTRTPYEVEHRIVRPDGTVRWVRQLADIDEEDGEHVRLVGVVQDITEYRELEAQLRQAQKMEAIGTLAGGIAHDFNNILAAIVGNLELAQMELAAGRQPHEFLRESLKSVRRATQLVEQILTFSRQQPQRFEAVNVRDVVEDTVGFLRASIPAGVTIEMSLDDATPLVVGDETQVHQIVMNLVTNAWQSLPDAAGTIAITVSPDQIPAQTQTLVSDLPPGTYVRLQVSDNGSGIDPATVERIFDPFFSTKEQGQGTGLGLAVVLGIVESHGGGIDVRSEHNAGTTMTIWLPAAEHHDLPQVKTEVASAGGNGRHVLFVDDEEQLVDVARAMLSRLDYEVTAVSDPAAAVALARGEEKYDVLLTDMNMPGKSGVAVAREVIAAQPHIRVVLASGNVTEDVKRQVSEIGAAILNKPYSVDELARILDER